MLRTSALAGNFIPLLEEELVNCIARPTNQDLDVFSLCGFPRRLIFRSRSLSKDVSFIAAGLLIRVGDLIGERDFGGYSIIAKFWQATGFKTPHPSIVRRYFIPGSITMQDGDCPLLAPKNTPHVYR